MRYYVYISESKVEMLYSQIPRKLLENIAGKLTIDLKLIKTEFSESPKEKTLHSKIQIVQTDLYGQGLIGNTRAPNSYIKGVEYMKWGHYPSGLVYFGSTTDVIIGLGGSEKHVVGNIGDSHAHSHSATPYLLAALNEQIENIRGPLDDARECAESIALCGVELATTQMNGLKQNGVLAKNLLCFPSDFFEYTWGGRSGLPVILGFPLYVAKWNDHKNGNLPAAAMEPRGRKRSVRQSLSVQMEKTT